MKEKEGEDGPFSRSRQRSGKNMQFGYILYMNRCFKTSTEHGHDSSNLATPMRVSNVCHLNC